MRPAREAPVADGGVKGNRSAVEDEPPVRGAERRHDFTPAATAAFVGDRCVGDGHKNDTVRQVLGDKLHKFVRQR